MHLKRITALWSAGLVVLAWGNATLAAGVSQRIGLASHSPSPAVSKSDVQQNPGVVVCEPTAPTDDALAHFGAGCGRWLFLTVGGHGELGQTPSWSTLDRVRQELGRQDLRLTIADVVKIASMTGATHIAVGQIGGDPQHCTLSYQLYALPSRIAVGPPLNANGTEAEVTAALPGMAIQMTHLLGVASPRVPSSVEATPEELTTLGAAPWLAGVLPPEQEAALSALAVRIPLAGVLAMESRMMLDYPRKSAFFQALLQQAPDNPLVLGRILTIDPESALTYQDRIGQGVSRFPHNAQLIGMAGLLAEREHDWPHAIARMAQDTRISPHSPDAWLALAEASSGLSQSIRLSRVTADIPGQEQSHLDVIYEQVLRATKEATQLDPLYGMAWLNLAEAATFQGEQDTAVAAFWKAYRLGQSRPSVYAWGTEMFNVKWGGDPAALAKVTRLAVEDHYATVYAMSLVVTSLTQAQELEAAHTLLDKAAAIAADEVRRQPDFDDAHRDMVFVLQSGGKYKEAIVELRRLVVMDPNDPTLYHSLGLLLSWTQHWDDAVPDFKTAIALDPLNEDAHLQYGLYCAYHLKEDIARTEFETVQRLNPEDAQGWFGMGVVDESAHDRKAAVEQYRKAVALAPFEQVAHERLALLLDADKQLAEALGTSRQLLEHYPSDILGWTTASDVYCQMKRWGEAVAACDAGLKIYPKNAILHLNRGEALSGQGKTAEARVEWRQVLTLDTGAAAKEAQEDLAKNL